MRRVITVAVALILAACGEKHADVPVVTQPGPAPAGMVWVPGGEFQMGDDGEHSSEAERPIHRVRVDGFFMDAKTITNAEFAAFVKATGFVTVAERTPDAAELLKQLPPGDRKSVV